MTIRDCGVFCCLGARAIENDTEKNYFSSFEDEHTVGLWLFDEKEYPWKPGKKDVTTGVKYVAG